MVYITVNCTLTIIIKHIIVKNKRAARTEITKISTDTPVLSVVAADMIHNCHDNIKLDDGNAYLRLLC